MEAASVTIETAPDSGSRLRREVEMNLDDGAPEFARQVLLEVVDRYPAGSSTVRAYVAITFTAANRVGGKKRKPEEMGRELAARLPSLTAGLQATGAGAAHPLSAQDLCEVIRVAYDPAAALLIDDAHAAGSPSSCLGRMWARRPQKRRGRVPSRLCLFVHMGDDVGAAGNVQSGVLTRLLAPNREIARKRVTLLYRPIDAARAAAIVESDLRAAEFRVTSTSKPAARETLAVRAAAATAQEEASGAGLVQFGMLVTATVTDTSREADARAAIDNLAATARLRLRPVYGSQDSAFAAALPLGLVLPKHIKVPAELRRSCEHASTCDEGTKQRELRPQRPPMRGWLGRGRGQSNYVQQADEWRGTTVQVCGMWPFSIGAGTPWLGCRSAGISSPAPRCAATRSAGISERTSSGTPRCSSSAVLGSARRPPSCAWLSACPGRA
ncbi:SCO6880 family protein [Oerskovia sp. M15]